MDDDQRSQKEQEILLQLSGDDPALVRAAAFEAGAMGLTRAVGTLVRLFENSSVGVQEAAEYALRKIRGPVTVKAVAPILRSDDATPRNMAMDILREIGEDDIHTLTRLLHDDDPDIRIFIADILGSARTSLVLAPLCEVLLHDPEVNVRYQAAVSLGSLGSVEAAESLRLALNDEEWVQFAVMEALAKIKAESCVDILLQALETCSPLVASTAIDALGEINSVKAAPLLLAFLEKSSGPLRTKALKALIRILGPNSLSLLGGKQLNSLQAYMLAALNDEDEETLMVVLSGLAYTGVNPASTKAVLKLVAHTDPDSQQELLQQELNCLIGIGYNEALEEALNDTNELVRHLAVEACGSSSGRTGRNAIKRHFDHLDQADRRRAVQLLAANGDEMDVSFFTRHLDSSEDPFILREALHFLGVQMRHVESAPRMLEMLIHPDDMVKEASLEACLALEDENTARAITAHAKDSDPTLRKMAIYTMGAVGAAYFSQELAEAVNDPEPDVRKVALEAIGCGEPLAGENLRVAGTCLNDENRDVRLAAVELLGRNMQPDVVPVLLQALNDSDDWVKVRALEALGRSRVAEASPVLVQMLEHSSLLVQIKVTEALGNIGDDVAFRALLGMMGGHDSPEIQSAAAEAIARIRHEEGGNA